MHKPINENIVISDIPDHGRFGGIRKHDIHTGVDLYCNDRDVIYAMESGTIVNIVDFTGTQANSPWWEDTKAILVEGPSGVILYGELYPGNLTIGDTVNAGNVIGNVKRVLRNDKGLPMTMLHIELYSSGYRGSGEWWITDRPEKLLNIEQLLKQAY